MKANLAKTLSVTTAHSLTGALIQSQTYTGEGDTLSVVWALPLATTEGVEAAVMAQVGTYKVVVVPEATPEAISRWIAEMRFFRSR